MDGLLLGSSGRPRGLLPLTESPLLSMGRASHVARGGSSYYARGKHLDDDYHDDYDYHWEPPATPKERVRAGTTGIRRWGLMVADLSELLEVGPCAGTEPPCVPRDEEPTEDEEPPDPPLPPVASQNIRVLLQANPVRSTVANPTSRG